MREVSGLDFDGFAFWLRRARNQNMGVGAVHTNSSTQIQRAEYTNRQIIVDLANELRCRTRRKVGFLSREKA